MATVSCSLPVGSLLPGGSSHADGRVRVEDLALLIAEDARVAAKNVYSGISVGGVLHRGVQVESKQVSSHAPHHHSWVGGGFAHPSSGHSRHGFEFKGGVTTHGAMPFDAVGWERLADLARSVVPSNHGHHAVFVVDQGGVYSTSDECHVISRSGEFGNASPNDNGRTLVVYRGAGSVCLTRDHNGRQFGPSVLAPFARVIVTADLGYVDGYIVARSLGAHGNFGGQTGGDVQLHGDSYSGPLSCSRDPATLPRAPPPEPPAPPPPPLPPALPPQPACACATPETGCLSGGDDVSDRCHCGRHGVNNAPFCYVLFPDRCAVSKMSKVYHHARWRDCDASGVSPSPPPPSPPPPPQRCALVTFERAPGPTHGYCREADGGKGRFIFFSGDECTTHDECRQACEDRVECVAYESSKNRCELHLDPITHSQANSGVVCFIKRCTHYSPPPPQRPAPQRPALPPALPGMLPPDPVLPIDPVDQKLTAGADGDSGIIGIVIGVIAGLICCCCCCWLAILYLRRTHRKDAYERRGAVIRGHSLKDLHVLNMERQPRAAGAVGTLGARLGLLPVKRFPSCFGQPPTSSTSESMVGIDLAGGAAGGAAIPPPPPPMPSDLDIERSNLATLAVAKMPSGPSELGIERENLSTRVVEKMPSGADELDIERENLSTMGLAVAKMSADDLDVERENLSTRVVESRMLSGVRSSLIDSQQQSSDSCAWSESVTVTTTTTTYSGSTQSYS